MVVIQTHCVHGFLQFRGARLSRPVDGTLIFGPSPFGDDSASGKGKIPNARGARAKRYTISSDIEPTQMTFLLVFSRSGDTGAKCAQAVMSLQTHEAHLHLHASITGPLKIGFPCKRVSPVSGQRASNLPLPPMGTFRT
jgi:hypothetical protein